jgi:hypothetical protein
MEDPNDLKDVSYLGDGVYVGHDDYQLWLYSYHGQRVTNKIALNNSVYKKLIAYKERIANEQR